MQVFCTSVLVQETFKALKRDSAVSENKINPRLSKQNYKIYEAEITQYDA